jgi:hypothetical protein
MKKLLVGLAIGVVAVLVGLVLLLSATQVEANNIQYDLHASGVPFMYKHYPSGELLDRIQIWNEDDIATVCSINGVTTVWINDKKHTCEPV